MSAFIGAVGKSALSALLAGIDHHAPESEHPDIRCMVGLNLGSAPAVFQEVLERPSASVPVTMRRAAQHRLVHCRALSRGFVVETRGRGRLFLYCGITEEVGGLFESTMLPFSSAHRHDRRR